MKSTEEKETGHGIPGVSRLRPSYIELAGTNIEHFDRALKAGTWHLPVSEAPEPEQ